MARRSNHADDDSLELLLDTICNVFGGIILMAILVVLQTQGGLQKLAPVAQSPDTPLDMEKLTFEIQRIDKQLSELVEQKTKLDAKFRESASPDTAALLDRREEFVKAVQMAEHRIEELDNNEAQARKTLTLLTGQETQFNQEAGAAEKKVEIADKRLEQQINASKVKARLPQQHETRAARQRIFLVVGDRVYRHGGFTSLSGTYTSGDCTVTMMREVNAAALEPRQGYGTKMADDQGSAKAFRAVLDQDDPKEYYLTFCVYADNGSFATFQMARTLSMAAGFEYSVGAYAENKFVGHFGDGPPAE